MRTSRTYISDFNFRFESVCIFEEDKASIGKSSFCYFLMLLFFSTTIDYRFLLSLIISPLC